MTAPVMVGPSSSSGRLTPPLTDREMELLTRVALGESYPQIASDWMVEQITVRTTGHRVLRKLGANTITHAVFLACRAGLLDGRPQRHGDHAGFAAHERRGEDPWACTPCAEGERAYRRDLRAARKTRTS